jgi:hypothetical protein
MPNPRAERRHVGPEIRGCSGDVGDGFANGCRKFPTPRGIFQKADGIRGG